MDFTFLGTSAGTPTKARNVSALALQHGGPKSWYLIDCGEGTQHQLLRTRYSVMQLQAIFVTHAHGDHSFGLPGLLASASMSGRTAPLPVIAPQSVQTFIETALQQTDSKLGFQLEFIDSEAAHFSWADLAVQVTSAPLSHRIPCHAFIFTELNIERQLLTDKLRAQAIPPGPVWGQLQQGRDVVLEDGKRLYSDTYTTTNRVPRRAVVAGDNDRPELLRQACQDAHVLIHEATYTQEVADRVGPWPQHSSAAQVAKFAQSVGLPSLALTHFSARYQTRSDNAPSINEIANEAKAFYNGNLFLAHDFATFRLGKDLGFAPLHEPDKDLNQSA